MDKIFNEDVCDLKHEEIKNAQTDHRKWLEGHDADIADLREDISDLKVESREYKTDIKNLIKKMDSFLM